MKKRSLTDQAVKVVSESGAVRPPECVRKGIVKPLGEEPQSDPGEKDAETLIQIISDVLDIHPDPIRDNLRSDSNMTYNEAIEIAHKYSASLRTRVEELEKGVETFARKFQQYHDAHSEAQNTILQLRKEIGLLRAGEKTAPQKYSMYAGTGGPYAGLIDVEPDNDGNWVKWDDIKHLWESQ